MIAGYKLINPYTKQPTGFVEKIQNGTKIHTIRRGDRWGKAFDKAQVEGRDLLIQHCTGVRTKHFKNFQTDKVVGVQRIFICEHNGELLITIDNKVISDTRQNVISKCDGFENRNDFANWFISDIKENGLFFGEIIHWTELKY